MIRLTLKIVSLLSALIVTVPVSAMDSLDDESLAEESGQAGADITVKFTINHDSSANFVCADLVYCRLAMSLNNRYHDGSQDTYDVSSGNRTPSATGRKQWLVFKGIQGTINIQELKFDGEDVTYNSIVRGALKFGFTPTKPIQIRNFGFQSLALETDTVAAEGTGNTPGYLSAPGTVSTPINPGTSKRTVTGKYDYSTSVTEGSITYNTSAFDHGRETGFLGLNVNANLSLAGSVKMFSCSSANGHPRC